MSNEHATFAGSSYTIASKLAAEKVTGIPFSKQQFSSKYLAGVDGQPLQMKQLGVNSLSVGDFKVTDPLSLYAADVPGLVQVLHAPYHTSRAPYHTSRAPYHTSCAPYHTSRAQYRIASHHP